MNFINRSFPYVLYGLLRTQERFVFIGVSPLAYVEFSNISFRDPMDGLLLNPVIHKRISSQLRHV